VTWEFKLRRGVKFHDGSEFTAADVVASIERVPTVPNSPSPFTAYTKQIKETIVVDPYTIRFRTANPYPLMPSDMTQIAIISKNAAKVLDRRFQQRKGGDRNGSLQARPLCEKRSHRARAQRCVLGRQDALGQGDAAAAAAGRGSGRGTPFRDVQVIENVPTSDVAKLKQDKRLAVYRTVADRLIYLHMDSDRDASPFVTDKAGKPLAKNPLKDARVRKAISKAINRPAIVDKVMEGEAIACGQLVPDFCSAQRRISKPKPFDPGGRQEASRRSGLSGWIRAHDSRAQQSLRQRCEDCAGRARRCWHASVSTRKSSRCHRRRTSPRQPI
jgi:peptide/nickel transport system substrate-binding protein